jgi:hypothetical protein
MGVAQKLGRFIGRNLPTGESAERELDRFISSRHEKRVATEGESGLSRRPGRLLRGVRRAAGEPRRDTPD